MWDTSIASAEGPLDDRVGEGLEQGLDFGFAAPEPPDSDFVVIEVDLGADQSMRPLGKHFDAVAEHRDVPGFVGASQKDQYASKRRIEVEPPALGKNRSRRSQFATAAGSPSGGPELRTQPSNHRAEEAGSSRTLVPRSLRAW